ncbi:MAG: TRAP transporter small permease [Firmicutes bacterium]|nr:TRAP transporter small permease [Bacillota bacterium]
MAKSKLGRFAANLEEYVVAVSLLVIVAITFSNVISRYVFNMSIAFSEELAVNLLIWVSLFGSAIAARRGAHLGLSVVTDLLPRGGQRLAIALATILAAGLYALLGRYGVEMIKSQMKMGQISPGLGIPEWTLSLSVPVGCAILTIRFIEFGVREWRKGAAK